jgi:hypothetical protein
MLAIPSHVLNNDIIAAKILLAPMIDWIEERGSWKKSSTIMTPQMREANLNSWS